MECLMYRHLLKHHRQNSKTSIILSELADSDDEKPTRGPTRSWTKRRKENGFFETIIRELILEDLAGFKEMFRMGYADFEKILSSIVVRHIQR